LHELGLAIAHSQHHQHGAYVIEHSDVAGFSRTEQQVLAALVRNQRRGLDIASFDALPGRVATAALRCALLLRLAVLLHRSHDDAGIPLLHARVSARGLELSVSGEWLAAHPLTAADFDTERAYLDDRGLHLALRTV
jgi:exopolyphosphatase/guanosine-5'-triphosphate,3'-diphosphate pyrophosphatase